MQITTCKAGYSDLNCDGKILIHLFIFIEILITIWKCRTSL